LFNERTKIFRIINTFLLSKASNNQLSLITLNAAICTILDLVHSTTINNNHRRIKRNQKPNVVETQCLNFICYSTMPNLIPIGIRKHNRFIERMREYSRDRASRRSWRGCQTCCLCQPWKMNHRMSMNLRTRGM